MRPIARMLMGAGAAVSSVAASAQLQAPTIYGVIFEVTTSADGTDIADFKVARVADPRKEMAEAAGVAVGPAYISKARALMAEKLKQPGGQPSEKPFFTYFFYDPARPGEVLLSAK